jgi:hypothetical protein
MDKYVSNPKYISNPNYEIDENDIFYQDYINHLNKTEQNNILTEEFKKYNDQ